MKTLLTYSLVILVTFAFNFKAINYLIDVPETVYVIDCEEEEENKEEKRESEKEEKSEKKEASEYLFQRSNSYHSLNLLVFSKMHNFLFIPSGFSQDIEMPPKHSVG